MPSWRITLILFLALSSTLLFAQRATKKTPQRSAANAEEAQAREQEDREGIEKLRQKEIQASIAYDIDAVSNLWTDDIVVIPPKHAPIQGRAAYKQYLLEGKDEMAKYDIESYDEQWDEVRVVGDYAWQWGVISSRLKPVSSNEELQLSYSTMRILKREEDGSWRVHRTIWNDREPPTTLKPQTTPPKKQ